ncbi:MAG TPA: hypothetical protein VF677_01415 [Flavobacterium sp.]
MKNIKHHAIVVTSADRIRLDHVRNYAIKMFSDHMEAKNGKYLISNIIDSLINNFATFFIAPDGSKEGYDASDDGDLIRKKITDYMKSLKDKDGKNPICFVEVSYGAEDENAEIITKN